MLRRRLLACLPAFVALSAAPALAMWARMSERELLDSSDLIVIGTFTGYETLQVDGAERRVGVIAVAEVLRGTAPGPELALSVPQPGDLVSSTTLVYPIGAEGLWFLRAAGVVYAADHPQRFVPLAEAGPAITALRAGK